MIPQGKNEAATRAYCNAADIHLHCSFPECACRQPRDGIPAALEAAAAWDREHATELVTDAMIEAALKVFAQTWRSHFTRLRRAREAALREMGR